MKQIITLLAVMVSVAVNAADPGGVPGFVKAVFRGSACDTTSDVFANAKTRVFVPDKMYASSCLPEKTTVAYGGYMYMEKGIRYDFKGSYDDFVTVKIGSTWVLSKGNECQERTGSYTPSATDWYKIDLRVANNGNVGGCQTASQYGILWKTSTETTWHKFAGDSDRFKTGAAFANLALKSFVKIDSAQMRASDPTVMDIQYRVYSSSDKVNVRALAFEDGERSFWKVVRATTFVKDPDGNETACNIGDGIAANVPHKLAWKVSADWKTDLAKVKFEVLCSEQAQLPLKLQTIPATAKNPAMTIGYGSQTDADIFNAILWHYADGTTDIVNNDGYVDATWGYANQVDTTVHRFVNRTTIENRMEVLRWLYRKMGYEPLEGGNLMDYVRKATRKDIWFNSGTQTASIKTSTKPTNLYVGEKAYCVIDVSGGPSAASYPITYLDTEPVNGWSDEYKTTKILLRRCEAGKYLMQKEKEVTLTKPFYMGVFTITQKQYLQVMGTNPTESGRQGNLRPVEVSWNALRGNSSTYNWPTVKTVDPNTFVGKIRAKTGLAFDLPTEAQWEYACRAGTDSNYGNGGGGDNDLRLMGHSWSDNSVNVGLYVSNFWGLYDMHGNVGQWCLDNSDGYNSDPAVDYVGTGSGSSRSIRGYFGTYSYYYFATSFYRFGGDPSSSRYNRSGGSTYLGFRLSRTLAE